jgi:small subunit ribosomal protein S18
MAGKKSRTRRRPPPEPKRQKKNPLKGLGVTSVDYKDTQLLRTFISERGDSR